MKYADLQRARKYINIVYDITEYTNKLRINDEIKKQIIKEATESTLHIYRSSLPFNFSIECFIDFVATDFL